MDINSLGKTPISADQPAGSDVRYEPEFDTLQAEIDKLSSPTASGGVDWKRVGSLSSQILQEKSKDILVAGYLAVSQIHCAQVEGFVTGLGIYRDLIEQFWDGLFPAKKRMRGRIGAIEWWAEKTEAALKQLPEGAFSAEQMQDSLNALDRIDSMLRDYLDDPPSISAVKRSLDGFALQEQPSRQPSPEPPKTEAQPKPEPVLPPKPEQPQQPPAAEGIESEKDASRILRSSLQELRKVATYFMETSPENPLSYRCTRIAAWSSIDTLPPNDNNKTRIPSPDAGAVKILHELYAKQDWESLMKSAERRLNQFIFCLDLNRFVATSLENMGSRYRNAHETVCRETAFFVHRLPGLAELTFADGTPFADAQTKDWLRLISLGGSDISVEALPSQGQAQGDGDDGMTEKIGKAKDLAGKNKLLEAVEALQEELVRSTSARQRMLWRLALAEILFSSKQIETALPHLEDLRSCLDRYNLEDWEPDLALRSLLLVWKGFSVHAAEESKRITTDALNRIAKLSPRQALLLAKK